MKYRPKSRPHLRKAKQKELDRLADLHESIEEKFPDCYPCLDPYAVSEEPTVEDMLEAPENNLPDR